MNKAKNTYVLVAEDGDGYELVETHIFTRNDIDKLGFTVNPTEDDTVFAITVEKLGKEIINKKLL